MPDLREPPSPDLVSLSEVHRSVPILQNMGFLRRLFAFAGPAYMVSVGYMDPGNWATDLEGGARFSYDLIWVLLMSNAMAVLLQTLSARLGIVSGRDLAQACRESYSRPVGLCLWVLCEIAIAACDLAEVLGTAIGLNLLFGISIITGVVITAFDVMLLLAIQRMGIRKMEAFILLLISTIGGCFILEIFLAKPDWGGVVGGLVPRLNAESLYVAIGILGATVMPHNLYLHSALVQTRQVARTPEGIRQACKYNLIDSAVALNAAFFVNAAILILAASTFYRSGIVVSEIQQAHHLLEGLLGTAVAPAAFAIALLCSGQSSTLTGTLAGQIVMEGFLEFKMRIWLRRLLTRSVAIVPAVICIFLYGEGSTYKLLILSQVILSLQLPFAVIPLIQFTSDRARMGEMASPRWVRILAWVTAIIIVGLNAKLVVSTLSGWIEGAGENAIYLWATAVPAAACVGLLLVYVILVPILRRRRGMLPVEAAALDLRIPKYARIGVAIENRPQDAEILSHAVAEAKEHGADLCLIHIVEGVVGQVYGAQTDDREARSDQGYVEQVADRLRGDGLKVTAILGFGDPAQEIIRIASQERLDLLIMGGHGHRGLIDVLMGTTVSPVRHALRIPITLVR